MMNKRSSQTLLAALGLTVSALSFPAAAGQNPVRQADARRPDPAQRAVLDRYCVTCHNDRAKTAGLSLERVDLCRRAGRTSTCGKRSCGRSGRA